MWLEDLRAESKAVRAAGMQMTLAAPLMDKLDLPTSGSFNAIQIRPGEQGFAYQPLPFYITMKQFLRQRGAVAARLTEVIRECDVVQMGYGGHPVALGEVALPIARKLSKKIIWTFDGADPFPRLA